MATYGPDPPLRYLCSGQEFRKMRRLGYLTRSPSIALHMRTGPALKHFAEHAARCARSARAPVSEWIAAQVALVRAQTSAPAQAGSCGALGCETINLQGRSAGQSPLCSDSDQIPQRREMTRRASSGRLQRRRPVTASIARGLYPLRSKRSNAVPPLGSAPRPVSLRGTIQRPPTTRPGCR